MKLTQIRNATNRLDYAGKIFLIDPWLMPKHQFSFVDKTFYLAGDTIWYPAVADTLKRCQPEVVALNCCAAETVENGRLIMDAEDVHCVAKTAPNARLYLTHLDNVAHAALTRHTLKGKLAERGVTNYDMPNDGQSVMY